MNHLLVYGTILAGIIAACGLYGSAGLFLVIGKRSRTVNALAYLGMAALWAFLAGIVWLSYNAGVWSW